MSNWVRLDEKRVRNVGVNKKSQQRTVLRVYGKNGRMYPRLVIAVFCFDNGFKLDCATKRNNSALWFNHDDIPNELRNDAIEMLKESKELVEGKG